VRTYVCRVTLALWVVTIGAFAFFFVKGWTTSGVDQRTAIMLAPSEREVILSEMRMLLKAVHGVVTGLGETNTDWKVMEAAGRSAGMGMAVDVEPALMAKLPWAFKQMGMSIHRDMDALADAAVQKETPQQILRRLSSMTARCTTCHDMYQLVSKE
jgi:hypothetical protein